MKHSILSVQAINQATIIDEVMGFNDSSTELFNFEQTQIHLA